MDAKPAYDPVFVNARREAGIIFVIWLIALLWAVPYCYVNGYEPPVPGRPIATVMGVPAWVWWGIAVPWLVADVLTIGFCLFVMKDDDLGEPQESELTQAGAQA